MMRSRGGKRVTSKEALNFGEIHVPEKIAINKMCVIGMKFAEYDLFSAK